MAITITWVLILIIWLLVDYWLREILKILRIIITLNSSHNYQVKVVKVLITMVEVVIVLSHSKDRILLILIITLKLLIKLRKIFKILSHSNNFKIHLNRKWNHAI